MPDNNDDDYVRVVDKLPRVPPSQIVFRAVRSGRWIRRQIWRWTGAGWEPDKEGTTVPSNRIE